MPSGTEIKPIKVPIKLLIALGMFLGVSPNFSLKKIKKIPTQAEKIENNKRSFLVSKLDAMTVPKITPATTNNPNDFINAKSTALNCMWVLVLMTEVGIIIAKDVPNDKCILVVSSKCKTVKA